MTNKPLNKNDGNTPYYGERHDMEDATIENYGNMTYRKSKKNDKETRNIDKYGKVKKLDEESVTDYLIECTLRESINEELGIADNVREYTQTTIKDIISDIQTEEKKQIEPGVKTCTGVISKELMNNRCSINNNKR